MKSWIQKGYHANTRMIAEKYKISEIFAQVLVNRGLFDWETMNRYLFPKMEYMRDSNTMKDFTKAVDLLCEGIEKKKKILVVGDYDVDGVMATYILHEGIRMAGGEAGYRIPHRVEDGYGIREYMVEQAKEQGYQMIVTCDNGISAYSAVELANRIGMEMIVTDHHEVPKENGVEVIPPARAVVDPKQEQCTYEFKQLCGAGIAYKIVAELLKRKGKEENKNEFLPFAAIATVCDVVPLQDENRIIVKNGLEELNRCTNVGLKALIKKQQFSRKVNSGDLGFRIGPCINAAGRLDDAKTGLELFLEQDKVIAEKKAEELVRLNEERKEYTANATQKAIDSIEQNGMLNHKVYVVFVEDCHESVAGIVAGRIRERYYRPTLILTRAKEGLKGSARSIPGYHMQLALTECKDLLKEFGGHAMAAGFSLPEENLESFRKQLNDNCTLPEEEFVEKVIFDKEVPLGEMSAEVVRQLDYMEPFGEGNSKAVFAKRNVSIVSVRLCGKENQIAQVQLKDGIRTYRGVDFQYANCLEPAICDRYGKEAWENIVEGAGQEYVVDILYQPDVNDMYGNVQFRIVDAR